ncbi:hypothetical protein [Cognatiluteimonas weifangensis]|uniref:hypothetical protein n=1 Tax=Cognatiluteimonas weifangensis TaxID=2303539 RepID=UPI0011C1ADE2
MIIASALFLLGTACAPAWNARAGTADFGRLPIGAKPTDLNIFVTSDCEQSVHGFDDCSAKDAEGREYAFFNGVLSKVSAKKAEATDHLALPANLMFGENINLSAQKVSRAFGVNLDRAPSPEGLTAYSSDFVLRSSAGVMYSIELSADKQENLVEIVGRTDF